jgi:4-hydroxythreonine-4-phosphate dehydrogenase
MTLAVSTGDPAGVGPRIAVRAALVLAREGESIQLFGDAAQLERLFASEGGMLGRIVIEDTGRVPPEALARHAPDADCGRAQLRALDAAVRAVREGRARALVTAPVSKAAVARTGAEFTGHTEYLARSCGLPDDAVTMLFLGPRLRIGLVTTHLAVRDVPTALTERRVLRTIRHLGEALVRLERPHGASLAVASLNPHAGEGGMFGDEEKRIIAPALARASATEPFASGRIALAGILSAETAFRRAAEGAIDGVVAMMHDQATIPSKLLDWGHAVNVTWGLPFVRTSVDHGVAYDAAARGEGDETAMIAAMRMACTLAGGEASR